MVMVSNFSNDKISKSKNQTFATGTIVLSAPPNYSSKFSMVFQRICKHHRILYCLISWISMRHEPFYQLFTMEKSCKISFKKVLKCFSFYFFYNSGKLWETFISFVMINVLNFWNFSRICTATPPSGENLTRKNPASRMSNLQDPKIGY